MGELDDVKNREDVSVDRTKFNLEIQTSLTGEHRGFQGRPLSLLGAGNLFALTV